MPLIQAGPRSIWCETAGGDSAGEGFPIVLLHGIGSNSKSWRRQLAALSGLFQVTAWDAPGFGRSSDPLNTAPSMKEYVDALLGVFDGLGFTAAAVIGHSLGGIIAQEFYRSHPDRVSALILADTTQGGGKSLEKRLQMIQTMTPSELARERAPRLLSKGAPQDLQDEAISIMSEIRPSGYEFAARAMADADTRDVLNAASVPLLMIWGADDEITPVWSSLPSGARLEIIPGSGHLCYMEQPERFNSIVTEFLLER